MSGPAGEGEARKSRLSGAWPVVIALGLGLAAGSVSGRLTGGVSAISSEAAAIVGGLWLDALKMTVIPLVMGLLVKGVVGGAAVAGEGRIAARAVAWFAALYVASAALGMVLMPLLLDLFPLSQGSADAMRAGFAAVDPASVSSSVAGLGAFIRSFLPGNVFEAAASGSILQVVVFTLLFAIALTRLPPERRAPIVALFDGLVGALLVVIGWVLALAPLGVFALAFTAAGAAGHGFAGAVAHFIALYIAVGLVVILLCYLAAILLARMSPAAFARAMAPTQAIAFSTQSSVGSLPAMLVSAQRLGISEKTADIVIPMAAALFRVSGPAMNIAVVIFIARMLGMDLGAGTIAAGIAVGSLATISAPGLPGQVSYFTSIAPISMAMGVPIAPLGMLIAVEPVPDMVRTVANVTMDVALAGVIDRGTTSGP